MKAIDKVKYFISKSLNNQIISENNEGNIYFDINNFKLFTVLYTDPEFIKIPTFFRNIIDINKINYLNSSINFLLKVNNVFSSSYKTLESIMLNTPYTTLNKYKVKNEVVKIGKGLILNGEDTVLFMIEDVIEKDRYSTELKNIYINKLVFNNKSYINDFIANKIYKLLIYKIDNYEDYTLNQKINVIITEDIPFILNLNSNENVDEINTNCNKLLNENIDLLINSLSNQLTPNEEASEEDLPF